MIGSRVVVAGAVEQAVESGLADVNGGTTSTHTPDHHVVS